MKILFINQAFYPDGVATAQHLIDAANYFIQNGHEVSVISDRRAYEDRNRLFSKRETYQGIEIYRISSTGFGKTSFLRRLIDALSFDFMLLIKIFTVPKHDVVVCLTSPPLVGIFGLIYHVFRGGEFVQWLMDINPEAAIAVGYLKRGSLVSRFLLGLFRTTLKASDRIIVLDRWMKQTIMAHGIDPKRILVIPPWPVVKNPGPNPEPLGSPDNEFRRERGWEDKFIVLYSGNHSVVHPLRTLLEAAKLLRRDKDIHFVFAGGGLRRQEVTNFVLDNGLDNISQLPFQPIEKLRSSLSMANLHVVVLGNEVNGLVHTSKVYGVLASGRPFVAICARQSHLSDLLQECPNGFQVEHGQPEKLAEAIREAKRLGNGVLGEFARKNSDYAAKNFRRETILEKFLQEAIQPKESSSSTVKREKSSAVSG